MTTYTEQSADVARMEAELDAARRRQVAAQREAAAAALSARLSVYQASLDAYDPAALRQSVVDTWGDALAAARDGGDVAAAIGRHMVAIMRETRLAQLALDAATEGATRRPGARPVPPAWFRDADGAPLSEDLAGAIQALLARAILQVADEDTRGEVEAVHAAATEAHASTLLAEPTGYRIEAAHGMDMVDTIGGVGTVRFADGVAYVMRAQLRAELGAELGEQRVAALVRYWRGVPGYQVHEIYEPTVPEHHTQSLRRLGEQD